MKLTVYLLIYNKKVLNNLMIDFLQTINLHGEIVMWTCGGGVASDDFPLMAIDRWLRREKTKRERSFSFPLIV